MCCTITLQDGEVYTMRNFTGEIGMVTVDAMEESFWSLIQNLCLTIDFGNGTMNWNEVLFFDLWIVTLEVANENWVLVRNNGCGESMKAKNLCGEPVEGALVKPKGMTRNS